MMLRLDKKGKPYQSTEYGLHGEDVKREISLVSDNNGVGLKSVQSLLDSEAFDEAEKLGQAEARRRYLSAAIQKKYKEQAKNDFYRNKVIKEQTRIQKTLSGHEMAALQYLETSKRPHTSIGSADFNQNEVVSAGIYSIDPRQPHTDYDRIVAGQIIGQPVGTPVVGYNYDYGKTLPRSPQMAGLFSDLADSIGLKDEYQAIRDSVKGNVSKEVEVFKQGGVDYVKNATGQWINKTTGQLLNHDTNQAGVIPASVVQVPGIGYVDKKWLYISGGVVGLAAIFMIMRLRK